MPDTVVIGDIHGCLSALDIVLGWLAPDARIVVTGDVIHKGPDSAGVVRRLREIGAELVLGNHEIQQRNYRKALAACNGDKAKIGMQNKDYLASVEESLSPEDIAYLETARLFVPVPTGYVVHGGILPFLAAIPTDAEIAALTKGERAKLECCTRVRYIRGQTLTKATVELNIPYETDDISSVLLKRNWDSFAVVRKTVYPKGEFLSLGAETPEDPFWTLEYDGRFGNIFFGHHPFTNQARPQRAPRKESSYSGSAIGLDLGCVFGNRLGFAILEPGGIHLQATPVQPKYADSLWED